MKASFSANKYKNANYLLAENIVCSAELSTEKVLLPRGQVSDPNTFTVDHSKAVFLLQFLFALFSVSFCDKVTCHVTLPGA